MEKSLFNITFTSFPPVSDSVKLHEPYYWYDLELHYPYVVINDYEKKKADG